MSYLGLSSNILAKNTKLNRFIRLNLLKYIVRPVRKVEDHDVIKSTEIQLDKSISIAFKKYLNAIGFQSKKIPTQFGEMHYYDSAPNSNLTPLIFIHGLGSSAQSWWILAQMLENKRRIIMPDLFHMAGFSKANNPVMDFLEHSKSIVELIKTITNEKVDICGLSLGGWISLHISATEKELINKVILMNPAGLKINLFALRDTLTYLSWTKFQTLYPGIMKAFPYTGALFLSKTAKRALFRNLKSEHVKDLLKLSKPEHFMDNFLSKIKCPVLLLWGREDQLLSNQIPYVLTEKIPNIKALWVEKCAHVLSLEAPINCYLEINHFLNLFGIRDNPFTKTLLSVSKPYPTNPIEIKENNHDY
ncbi:alpha/beta fold hydrolase [Fluviispira multicolorata]|uniref:Alpha/beta fold hydrolase n=1 Tax=Fluviispira multicolorata TaxID=2654512 RepID=A0A833JFQ5_9BACT|nr:alpha/beta hydrolase [Fluviispira multicolorata]KAB8031782.1 alpha/beta fold hydrolase [Fluviispira multicolorata]